MELMEKFVGIGASGESVRSDADVLSVSDIDTIADFGGGDRLVDEEDDILKVRQRESQSDELRRHFVTSTLLTQFDPRSSPSPGMMTAGRSSSRTTLWQDQAQRALL